MPWWKVTLATLKKKGKKKGCPFYYSCGQRPGTSNYVCNEILQNVDTNDDMAYSGSDSDTKINCSSAMTENETMNDNLNYKIAQSYYVFLFAICFSTIKACNYWNDQTQTAIAEHAIELFDKVSNINPMLSTYLPKSTEICGKTFDIVYTSRHEGTLYCVSTSSRDALAVVISGNTMNNAGFLICFENSSLACIIQDRKCVKTSQRTKYFLLAADENREVNLFKELPDSRSVVDRLCEYLNLNEPDLQETEYMLQFLSIPCSVTRSEKRRILRNHKSNEQNEKIRETKKMNNKFMCPIKKKVLNESKVLKYKQMDPIKKKVLNESKVLKYKQIDPIKKKVLNESKVLKYKEMDPFQKNVFREKRAMSYKAKGTSEKDPKKQHDLDYYISKFHSRIKEGPYYVCSVCNRLLYRKSVKLLEKKDYSSVAKSVFTNISSFDNKEYVCTTCLSKVVKGNIPCQAVYNDMSVDEIPPELALLEKLEQILVAQRIVFEKIIVMPKGQQKKVSGAICNVPVNCDQTCKVLPRPPARSGIIMLKLKRKLEFRGHVYFQAVRPQVVENALNWLMQNNALYNNITTDMNNISEDLKTLQKDASTDTDTSSEKLPTNEHLSFGRK